MQEIIIKNFGPIKEANIKIGRVTVLIGEQASGKSTIAKLIYFFKSLGDAFFEYYSTTENNYYATINIFIQEKFIKDFGTESNDDFSIKYYYAVEGDWTKWIEIHSTKGDTVPKVKSSIVFLLFGVKEVANLKSKLKLIQAKLKTAETPLEQTALRQEELGCLQEMSAAINSIFEVKYDSKLYMIAGREATISYESSFEKYLDAQLNEWLEFSRKKIQAIQYQSIDESLTLDFIKEVRRMKAIFSRTNLLNMRYFFPIKENIAKILKGNYSIEQGEEKITLTTSNKKISLKDASSGQKEAIRILQDIVLSSAENRKTFRVIEEPEAHLFPVAQKHLVELLVLMINQNTENELIITTHSPYILTVLNNLLLAQRIKNSDADHALSGRLNQIIDPAFHLDPNTFSAYSLGNSFFEQEDYCIDIFNPTTGLIKQNYLDTVSDMLGADFNHLFALYAVAVANNKKNGTHS